MSFYNQIQQTIFAISMARAFVNQQYYECVQGWGGEETYHSEQLKLKGEKLLELQQFWQERMKELEQESSRSWLDIVA